VNLILEHTSQVRYFTNMAWVFEALNLKASHFDWYVSDIETNCSSDVFPKNDRWIGGEELQHVLKQQEVQFVWAVFSAFPVGIRVEISASPYADGNPAYWSHGRVAPQLGDALFEIACWDSSATILIGLPEAAQESFRQAYPDTKPLDQADCQPAG
jgi:hypothetical protein